MNRNIFLAVAGATVLIAAQPAISVRAQAQDLSQPLPFTLKTKASTTTGASANIPPGTAPTSPNNGDLWTTVQGLFARINGATVGPFGTANGPTSSTAGDIPIFSDAAGKNLGDSGQTLTSIVAQVQTGCIETWCVDSVNGSDSNSGKPGSPYQTFAPLAYGADVLAGQSVGVACGSHWRAPLPTSSSIGSYNQSVLSITNTGTAATHNTVAAYGVGPNCSALPILDGSAIIPNSAFTNAGGSFPNVYYTPTEYFYGGANGYQIFVWETGAATDSATGTYLAYETSESAVNSNACSYYIPGLTWGGTIPSSAVVYIHTCDGTNPGGNGYTYEVSQQIPLTMSSSYGEVRGIEGRKSGSNTGVFNFNNNGGSYYLTNCIARDGGKHNALLTSGSTVNNCQFIDGYYNNGGGDTFVVFHDNTTSIVGSLPIAVNNSIFQQDQVIAGNGSGTGIISHTDDGTSMGSVSLTNDWFIAKNGVSFSAFSFANSGAVAANQIYGAQLLNGITPQQNLTLTNSQFVSYFASNYPIYVTADGITVSIDNTKFCGGNLSQGLVRVSGNAFTLSLTNSVMYGRYPNAANPTLVFNIGTGSTFYYYGDDFGSNVQYWEPLEDVGSGTTFSSASNNNIFEGASWTPGGWYLDGTLYSTLSTWQSHVSPADSNSLELGGDAIFACKLPDSMPEVQ